MDLGIAGKVALVCASSKGLGRASALALASEGVRVVINGRNHEILLKTADEIARETGAEVLAVAADVSKAEGRSHLIEQTKEQMGRISILVNNAGGPPPGTFSDFAADDYRRALELNLMSTIEMTRLAVPSMERLGWGRIVNITSVAVKMPISNLILSNTARTAIIGFAKTAATELAPKGILVNNVCPGTIFTDRIKELTGAQSPYDIDENTAIGQLVARVPLGRIGQPDEFGAVVAFLCSNLASYVTGTTLQVDGGAYTGLM